LLVIEQVLEASTAERKQVLPGKTSVSPMAAGSEQEGIPVGNDNCSTPIGRWGRSEARSPWRLGWA
jgi:hypothetical protein